VCRFGRGMSHAAKGINHSTSERQSGTELTGFDEQGRGCRGRSLDWVTGSEGSRNIACDAREMEVLLVTQAKCWDDFPRRGDGETW
jgi:hypothetical protein